MENNAKYTVITGASSGIGYAAAKAFAKRDKHLIIVARREERLKTLKDEISQINPDLDVVIKVCDLSVTQQTYQLYNALKTYSIETWINNAGFGNYDSLAEQNLDKIESMLHLNIEALTLLSSLYIRDYQNEKGTQLINVSSGGGYTIVPNAITYCASKFYVNAFTEGAAHELKSINAKMQAKVLAPAATKTEFGMVANDVSEYDYGQRFGRYHTSDEMAEFLLKLYDSDKTVGRIDRQNFTFTLADPVFKYADDSAVNQK